MCQGQYPLPYNSLFTGVLMMDSADAKQAQTQWAIQKNFDDCHIQF